MVGGQFKTQTLINAFELARRTARVRKRTDLKGSVRAGLSMQKAEGHAKQRFLNIWGPRVTGCRQRDEVYIVQAKP